METLIFDQEFGDKISIANTLNNLGLTHKALNEIDDAKRVFEKSLKIRQEIGDCIGITISLNNLGDVAYIQEKYEEALSLFNNILYEFATLLSATENKKLSLELICFILANGKKDIRLLNLANELFNKLIEGLPQSDIMNIQNEAKTAKAEKYIEHITKLFGG